MGTTARVELYNLTRNGRTVDNGWLVRCVREHRTFFHRFGPNESKAREFASRVNLGQVYMLASEDHPEHTEWK